VTYRDHSVGSVYVLLNPAMQGIVKIGRTERAVHARARELQTTGVPKQFIVLWHEYVHDSDAVEKKVHTLFSNSRVDRRREFFRVEPRDAIRALIQIAGPYRFELDDKTPRVSILPKLREKYDVLLRKDICEVYVAQSNRGIFLEVRRRPYKDPKREAVDYVDLDVLGGFFSEHVDVSRNAEKFLTLSEFSLVNVTNLFEEEAARLIWERDSRA
jgi:T5orf172 domain-containing protein